MEHLDLPGHNFNIIHILSILLKRKKLIIYGTVIIAILGIGVALLLPRPFISVAAISFGNISDSVDEGKELKGLNIQGYSKFWMVIGEYKFFNTYLDLKRQGQYKFFEPVQITRAIRPIYSLPEERNSKKENSIIIGIQTLGHGKTPQNAQELCRLLGEYIQTVALNLKIGEHMKNAQLGLYTDILKIDQRITEIRFRIRQLTLKEQFITQQLLPIGVDNNRLEVLSSGLDKEKYLTPQQQLVATKTELKDQELLITELTRDSETKKNILSYINKISPSFTSKNQFLLNENLLDSLIQANQHFFAGKVDETSLQAYNYFRIKFSEFISTKNNINFLSTPTAPKKKEGLAKRKLVIFISFTGFLLMICLAFFMDWWDKNKKVLPKTEPGTGI